MNSTADTRELDDLYRDLILNHARNPRNFRRLENATHTAEGINPLCGDKLHLYLEITPDSSVADAAFEGSGCAISMASASLLTETIANLSVAEAEGCVSQVTQRLIEPLMQQVDCTSNSMATDLTKLRALDGVRKHPARIKCATLAWQTLHAALQQQSIATTE
jgi:nitrogen fixation NifU-like protein